MTLRKMKKSRKPMTSRLRGFFIKKREVRK